MMTSQLWSANQVASFSVRANKVAAGIDLFIGLYFSLFARFASFVG
jgi:hypothetical protein